LRLERRGFCGRDADLMPRFDPAKVMQVIQRDRVTVF
jgi:hypothetical protein